MLRRLGIRGKILAVVAVPILVLVLAAGFVTFNAFGTLQSARNAAQLVELVETTKGFQATLREERDAGANYVAAYVDLFEQLGFSAASVDETVSDLDALAAANSTFAPVVADVHEVLDGSTGTSLADARQLRPGLAESGWPSWPATADIEAVTQSYDAMAAAVQEITSSAPENEDLTRLLGNTSFYLTQEGSRTEAFLTIPVGYEGRFLAATPNTDEQWASLDSAIRAIPERLENEAVKALLATATDAWGDVAATRETVRLRGNSAAGVRTDYNAVAEPLLDANSAIALAVGNPELALEVGAYGAIDTMADEIAKERNLVEILIRAQVFEIGDAEAARGQFSRTDFYRDEAQKSVEALGSDLVVPEWGASFQDSTSFESVRNRVSTGLDTELVTVANHDWTDQVDEEWAVQEPNYGETLSRASGVAASAQQAALTTTIVTAVAAIAIIVLSIIIALVIARRIVVPLRRLTTTATAVRQELPRLVERVAMPGETVDVAEVQIPVESTDEVGRLAEAFNGVNAATLAIATEQAALRGSISEMFVNVARRDQVLLNRQLQSIDEMERTEDNPDTLTKLFALDHLATRMRRNSESLLVLAGIDTGRRLRRSMPLSDVIRTASSEIELYERVQLELDADPAMLGHSSLTAAHLFAELLENATVFSDPGTQVVVRTDERDGAYIVTIQDFGIGMTEHELQEANNRVVSTAASEILGAQRLGLFVVGRIARRIGARVALESVEGQGTTATVTLASSLFDTSVEVDTAHTREAIVDEELHAPAALVSHTISEDQAFEEPGEPAVAAYQPTSVADVAPVVAAAGAAAAVGALGSEFGSDVDDLIAADAAGAPVVSAVDTDALTDGVGPTGLPTRRRREAPAPVEDESTKVIGLPVRATADQLSALEAESPSASFAPSIPANEVSPQTPEDRSQMFRGFRPRRDLVAEAQDIDPEAESLGHAARRGAIAPDDIPALAVPAIPVLEEDDDAVQPHPVDAVNPYTLDPEYTFAVEPSDVAEGAAVPSIEDEDDSAAAAGVAAVGAAAMIIPLLEDDEFDAAVAQVAEPDAVAESEPLLEADAEPLLEADAEPLLEADAEPLLEADAEPAAAADAATAVAGAIVLEPDEYDVAAADVATESVVDAVPAIEEDEPNVAQTPEPAYAAEPAATPFSYADAYATQQPYEVVPQQPWGVDQVSLNDESAAPSIDDIIADPASHPVAKAGFFGRLFGKSRKRAEAAPAVAAPAAAAALAQPAAESFQGFQPTAPVAEAQGAGFAPAPAAHDAPTAPTYDAPAAPAYETQTPAWAGQTELAQPEAAPSPGGAFALWGARSDAPEAPAFSPDSASGQMFTPDELANPYGWEAAGGAALAASEPEQESEYQPVVGAEPEEFVTVGQVTDMTSQVFSELSSLSASRPKVEKTRAGLQRRRAPGETAPAVKPIEPEVHMTHKDRNADEVRTRFSSFYSGTQRARHDVEEFEQRSRPAEVKE